MVGHLSIIGEYMNFARRSNFACIFVLIGAFFSIEGLSESLNTVVCEVDQKVSSMPRGTRDRVEVPIYQFVIDYKNQTVIRAVFLDALRGQSIDLRVGKYDNSPGRFFVDVLDDFPPGGPKRVRGDIQLLENGPSQKAWIQFSNLESAVNLQVEARCQMTTRN